MGYVLFGIGVVLAFLLIRHDARRFEARERARGRWDEYGPLVETEPPPIGMRSTYMSWRLEVIGRWVQKVVRRRRPHER
jgi:hypothetical protein